MHRLRFALIVFALCLPSWAGAQTVSVTETLLTGNSAADFDASISGDTVVFTTDRLGDLDLYQVDGSGIIAPLVTGPGDQDDADIDGLSVAYVDNFFGNDNISYLDVIGVSTPQLLTGISAADNSPSLSGNNVVFVTRRNGNDDLYTIDVTTGIWTPFVFGPETTFQPSIDGNRVAWVEIDGGFRILASTLSGSPTVVASGPGLVGAPDVDGDRVAYIGSTDVFVYDFVTAQTTQLTSDTALQRDVHIDGNHVLWADDRNGNYDIFLYDLASSTEFQLTTDPTDQILTDADGGSAVFHDVRFGNSNIFRLDFQVNGPPEPDIDIAPLVVDFGDVALPGSNMLIATVSNLGTADLTVSGIGFEAGSSTAFSIHSAPALPAVLAPEETVDVGLTFTPTALGVVAAGLEIVSDDPDEGSVVVDLTGAGVASEAPPSEQVAAILEFIGESVLAGTLAGDGPGGSGSGRLNALTNQIEAAGDLIDEGLVEEACDQLLDALRRTDGAFPPPDFVSGDAAPVLAQLIEITRDALGCE